MLLLLFLTLIKSTSSVDDLDCPTAHYQSQQGQTEWVASIFHPPSSSSISPSISPLTFVELGASDGVTFSNTYGLETCHSWSGVCIEPTEAFTSLTTSGRTNCQFVKSAVAGNVRRTRMLGAQTNAKSLMVGGTLWAGLEEHFDEKSSLVEVMNDASGVPVAIDYSSKLAKDASEPLEVETTTLGRVLDAINAGHRGHMDYLSLDVEGAEYEILESFPWEERSFGVITVEHSYIQANREKIKRLLESKGYVRAMCFSSDDGYVKASLVVDPNSPISRLNFDGRGCSVVRITFSCWRDDSNTKASICDQHSALASNDDFCDAAFNEVVNKKKEFCADHSQEFHSFALSTDDFYQINLAPVEGKVLVVPEHQNIYYYWNKSGVMYVAKGTEVKQVVGDFCKVNFDRVMENMDEGACVDQLYAFIERELKQYHIDMKQREMLLSIKAVGTLL